MAFAGTGVLLAGDFESIGKADAAFRTAEDEAVKTEAYAWMTNRLASTKSPAEVAQLAQVAHRAAHALGKEAGGEFTAFCGGLLESSDGERRASLASAYSGWLLADGDADGALKALESALAAPSGVAASTRTQLAAKAADIRSARLGDPEGADGFLDAQMRLLAPSDAESRARLLNASASIRRQSGRNAAALERADEAKGLMHSIQPGTYWQACEIRYLAAKDEGDADAAAELAAAWEHPGLPNTGIARKVVEAGASPELLLRSVSLLRGKAADAASDAQRFQSAAERVVPEIVELLVAAGRPEEAVRECRVMALAAPPRSYGQAMDLAARAFKSLDGNLGRAAELLAFLNGGEGRSNPLLALSPAEDADRKALLESLAPLPPSAAWTLHLERARLLLWLDRPAESVRSAAEAFSSCPMRPEDLRACAQQTAYPVLALLRDEELADRAIRFLLRGPAGEDGRHGTGDDVADPFPEIFTRLSYSADQTSADDTPAQPR